MVEICFLCDFIPLRMSDNMFLFFRSTTKKCSTEVVHTSSFPFVERQTPNLHEFLHLR